LVRIERRVRFEDVDAAGLVFFAHYPAYAHEAMERLFDEELEGGYKALIIDRRMGLPAVALNCSYKAPLRYGDTAIIEAETRRLGIRSAELGYRVVRQADGVLCAEIEHTVVLSNLAVLGSTEMPGDVRAALSRHLVG
jgi:YbgC/YbaW family acyl-CoA thioester hydrolase